MLPSVSDLSVVSLPTFKDARGSLGVADLRALVKFPVKRVFWINEVPLNGLRGGHAHKLCHQFMICLSGRIAVEAFDGQSERSLFMAAGSAVHIPPAIYATERFEGPSSVLAVLCDLPYDKNDYIYDRAELAAFRNAASVSH